MRAAILLLAVAAPAFAADPVADTQRFLRRLTERRAAADLADVRTLDDWNAKRPELRRQLFDMLGLSPLPPKGDLHATVTGTVDAGEFVVEKLYFQSLPGLYVTANFYRPKKVDKPLPTILYVCGHGNVKLDGVSYGSKASYQHHPAWFARHGYCCLILDTLQLGEIEGQHHGTYRLGWWWWVSRGYTPAGVEAWNGIRALDFLATRPEVDMTKLGVTGRSGGGIYTWWLTALDDRPACLVPVAGVTDLTNYVVDGCVEGHCDCMFPVNIYGWDFATLAALVAPRPLLFSNTDKDNIFPLDGVVRLHAKVRPIYKLHKADDKLGLLITEGPHKDTQELQVPAFRWMNRWLKGVDEPITRAADKPLTPQQLKVFATLPADQRNTTIQETFVPTATPATPTDRADWVVRREVMTAGLKERVFRNWPAEGEPLDVKVTSTNAANGLHLSVVEYTTEDGLRLPLYVVRGTKHAKPSLVVLTPVDSAGWDKWLATYGDLLGGALTDAKERESTVKTLERFDWAFATLPVRGEGPHAWKLDAKKDTHLRRRFLLLGRTLEDAQVWDARRAFGALAARDEWRDAKPWVQGHDRMAGVALYAGLFEPRVERFDLHGLPTSHREGPHFLGVQRVLDVPQAVALAFPRKVMLYGGDAAAWEYPLAVAKLYDATKPPLQLRGAP